MSVFCLLRPLECRETVRFCFFMVIRELIACPLTDSSHFPFFSLIAILISLYQALGDMLWNRFPTFKLHCKDGRRKNKWFCDLRVFYCLVAHFRRPFLAARRDFRLHSPNEDILPDKRYPPDLNTTRLRRRMVSFVSRMSTNSRWWDDFVFPVLCSGSTWPV
jgi:hypothetical protein